MVELENPFAWFTDDPLILLITTVGVLFITGLAMFDGIKIIHDYRKRPRIEFKPTKDYDFDGDGDRKIRFWVYVHNVGKGILSQCKVQIRITDHSGNLDLMDKTGKKYQEEFIPWNWEKDENQFTNELDLYPAKTEHGKFKLPFIATIHNDEGFGIEFTDPIKVEWKKNPMRPLKGLGKLLTFYVVFSIFINTRELSFEKKFRIVIPINIINQLEDRHVVFEEKKTSTLFSDTIYSFLTLFKRDADEN